MKKEDLENKISDLEMELRMSRACSDELRAENDKFRSTFKEVESWECQGGSLKEAYDEAFGAGEWDKLLSA